jgi:PleD family two-component response regulator
VLALPIVILKEVPVSKKGGVLIVRANPIDTEPLREHFENGDYKVLVANSQEEALALTRREMPRSVIIDVDCPGLDINKLADEIRNSARTRHIHITLLMQRGERTDKLGALTVGADEFMTKPVDVEELGLRIRNALRRAAFDNLANPTTGLPGPRLIEEQLRLLLRRQDDAWAMLRINIRHFGPFSDLYGFLASEEVLRFAAHLFGEALDSLSTADDFLGHSSADNFILITTAEKAPALIQDLTTKFAEEVKAHYSFKERERGTIIIQLADGTETEIPLMTLNIRTITAADGPFSDIRELTQA